MSTLVTSPFPVFTDTDGLPLEGGYIDIGVAGLNPLSNPLQVYWDEALTMPASNIRTTRGYPSRNGAAGYLYAPPGDFSILVRNKNGVVILSNLNIVDTLTVVQNTVQNLIILKADINSPILTGIPEAPTASIGTSTDQIATTEFVAKSLAGKNKLINGNMEIDQRNAGASKTFTAGGALAYGVDRWFVQCSGANITGQRVAGDSWRYGYKITGAALNTQTRFGQIIESYNTESLKNKDVMVSMYAKASENTAVTWKAFRPNAVDNWGASTEIATGTISLTVASTKFEINFNAGADVINGLSIEFRTNDLLATKWVQYEQIQLEEGSVATKFEERPYGLELALCQRYFNQTPSGGVSRKFCFVQASAANQSYGIVHFPVRMRKTPTLSYNGAFVLFNEVTSYAVTLVSYYAPYDASDVGSVSVQTSGGLATNGLYSLQADNSAASFLRWDAEF